MALPRHQLYVACRPRIPLAVRPNKAKGVVDRALRHVLHVFRRPSVFSVMNGVEANVRFCVFIVEQFPAWEAAVRSRHVPWKHTRGDGHDSVHLSTFVLRLGKWEGQQRTIRLAIVVGKAETILKVFCEHGFTEPDARVFGKELAVATRDIPAACDVTGDEDVLWLGDH